MKKSKLTGVILILLVLTLALGGCDIISVASVNGQQESENSRSRQSESWSGISVNNFTIQEGQTKEVVFQVNLGNGSVEFTLQNQEGEEVYTLSKEEAEATKDVFEVESAGEYTLIEKGKKFSGAYSIMWGDQEAETEN